MDLIKAKVILEIAGYPEEHVDKTIRLVIDRIKEEDNLVLEENEIFPTEKKDETFMTFSELTISFKKIVDIYEFCFNYMPSSIDILEPEDLLSIKPSEFNDSINDLLYTIHQHDMLLKNSNANLKSSNNNMTKLLSNMVLYLKKEGKNLAQISEIIGVGEDVLKKFVLDLKSNINKK